MPIVCELDGLLEGNYNYRIVVNDTDGYEAEDSVHVTVTEPAITSTSTTTTGATTNTSTTETSIDLSDLWTYSVIAVFGIVAMVVIIAIVRRR